MNGLGGVDISASALQFADKSVCVITHELAGLDQNGGIGTYCLQLSRVLADNGAKVEILYADERYSGYRKNLPKFREIQRKLSNAGVKLSTIGDTTGNLDRLYQSYQVMAHLRQTQPDIAFFSESNGAGFYSLIAKRTGDIRLASTTMCIVAHGSTEWSNACNEIPLRTVEGVNIYEMERRCVELADVLVSPSSFMVDKYIQSGWTVPENRIILPNTILAVEGANPSKSLSRIDNITFFGRLETRKGLWVFCAAMDRLRPHLRGKTVTFLGKPAIHNGVSTEKIVIQRSASWPCRVSIITNYDSDRALSYLANNAQLAVMPSIEDNSPSVIIECMSKGIPFVASDAGGGKELVKASDRSSVFVTPTAAGLAERLGEFFDSGCRVAKPSYDQTNGVSTYLQKLGSGLSKIRPRQVRNAAKKRNGRPLNYILLAGRKDNFEQVAAAARDVFNSCGPGTKVVVVSETAVAPDIATEISRKMPGKMSFVSCDCRMDEMARLLSKNSNSMTVLSRVNQIVIPDLVKRAGECFETRPVVAGVTAMVANADYEKPDERQSQDNDQPKPVADFLYSSSPMMMLVSGNSNAGFIVMQTKRFCELSELSFCIRSSMTLKDVRDVIHEIVLEFLCAGNDVEPVPDIVMPAVSQEVRTPTFDLINVLRSALGKIFGYEAGSDKELLARLAMEVVAVGMREKRQSEYLEKVRNILRDRVPPNYEIGSGSVSELVLIASALSHRETANELVMKACLPDLKSAKDIDSHIQLQINSIALFDALKKQLNVKSINLSHKWSMRLWDEDRKIEMHPNNQSEGRASIEFGSLDLRKAEKLVCGISIPSTATNAVRFRVDVISPRITDVLCEDRVLAPGESGAWEIGLGKCRSIDCRIILSVEMADPTADPAHCFVHWIDPQIRATNSPERKR